MVDYCSKADDLEEALEEEFSFGKIVQWGEVEGREAK